MAWTAAPGMPLYVVSHRPEFDIGVDWVSGSVHPVRLSLVAKVHEQIGVGLEKHQQGANLAIGMGKDAALKLYSEIRQLARTLDWSLPTEDEDQA